jgi:branched-chain amino acid transport system permease protein
MLDLPALARVDLQLWRWFFFGATLIVVMVLKPEGLLPSATRRAELRGDAEMPETGEEPVECLGSDPGGAAGPGVSGEKV